MSRWSQRLAITVLLVFAFVSSIRVSHAANYSAAMAQARRAYQQQMKEQAAIQKQIDLAEQQAAAAQAAEDRRKMELVSKARRAQREKEAARLRTKDKSYREPPVSCASSTGEHSRGNVEL